MYLTQLLPVDYRPPDGMEIVWPGDVRIWRYYADYCTWVPDGRQTFDGGDCWDVDLEPDWEDPSSDRPLPWIL